MIISFAAKFITIVLEIIYFPFKLLPTQKKITFISRQSNSASEDTSLLCAEIAKELPDCKVVVLARTIQSGFCHKIGYCFHMVRQMYHIATSKIVVLDSYAIVVSLLHHKKSLTVIQMWHALGLMKKAGYAIVGKKEGRSVRVSNALKMHFGYDYIFASHENCRKALGEVFNYPIDNILVYPLPHLDLMFSEDFKTKAKEKLIREFPQTDNKKTILYAPTFRKNDETLMSAKIEELINAIDKENYIFISRLHPLSTIEVHGENVIDDTHSFTTYELLAAADYVITDYSSVVYEAAVMKKPLLFYAFDYDSYIKDRELFIDYEKEIPGALCRTGQEIVSELEANAFDYEKIYAFASKYIDLNISNYTVNIVAFFKELI